MREVAVEYNARKIGWDVAIVVGYVDTWVRACRTSEGKFTLHCPRTTAFEKSSAARKNLDVAILAYYETKRLETILNVWVVSSDQMKYALCLLERELTSTAATFVLRRYSNQLLVKRTGAKCSGIGAALEKSRRS